MTLLEFCRDFFPGEEIFSAGEDGMTVHSCRLLELEYAGKEGGQLSWEQVLPSDILRLVQPGNWNYYDPRRDENNQCCRWEGERSFLLTQEALQTLQRFHLVIDPEAVDTEHERRPYFRVRGRPVTEEQAFDILRRTNMPLAYDRELEQYPWKDLVHSGGFLDNEWCSWLPRGWVRPDGTVGMNDISGIKYPYEREIMTAIIRIGLAFPYLDLIIAITGWNEAPDYAWKAYFGSDDDEIDDGDEEVYQREDYPDFPEHIVCGVWLHDSTVELMAPERAREKYIEYNRLYGGPDEEIFKQFYYKNKNLFPVDLAYLKRLIRAHGLEPEEVLAGYEWGPLGLRRQYREPEKNDPGQLDRLGDGFP